MSVEDRDHDEDMIRKQQRFEAALRFVIAGSYPYIYKDAVERADGLLAELEKAVESVYVAPKRRVTSRFVRDKALDLTNAIIADLTDSHHIQFGGRLTHTGRDMVSEKIVEPFFRRTLAEIQTNVEDNNE